MNHTEILRNILIRLKNRIKRKGTYLMEEMEYKWKGLPSEEIDCIKMYFKTRRADRYLIPYSNEKIKRVVIQIGMDKTASTSIQTFLQNHQSLLHRHSIEFKTDWGESNHSTPLKAMVEKIPERIYPLIVSEFSREQIDEYNCKNLLSLCRGIQACQQETYLFFGEGICSFRRGEYKTFQEILSVLMPNAEVEILYCVRSNVGYASSAYQQAVKLGRYDDVEEQIEIYTNLYEKRLMHAIHIFGKEKIQVYKFEDTIKYEFGPVGFFLEKLGISKEALDFFENTRTNESVSDHAIEIMAYINKKHPMVIDGVKNPLRKRDDTSPIMKISGLRYRISNEMMVRIMKEAQKDITWLKENFGVEYPFTHHQIEDRKLSYDEAYYHECMQAFNNLSDFTKSFFYEFVVEKHRIVMDPYEKEIFERIKKNMSGS